MLLITGAPVFYLVAIRLSPYIVFIYNKFNYFSEQVPVASMHVSL